MVLLISPLHYYKHSITYFHHHMAVCVILSGSSYWKHIHLHYLLRYTKALEVIKKLHKDQAQEIKTYKLKLDHLQTLKDAAFKVHIFFLVISWYQTLWSWFVWQDATTVIMSLRDILTAITFTSIYFTFYQLDSFTYLTNSSHTYKLFSDA